MALNADLLTKCHTLTKYCPFSFSIYSLKRAMILMRSAVYETKLISCVIAHSDFRKLCLADDIVLLPVLLFQTSSNNYIFSSRPISQVALFV
jgi:hypothetical protein